MATQLDEWSGRELTPRIKMNFEQWIRGGVWQLVKGVDFAQPVCSFRNYCFTVAQKHGLRVRTRIAGETIHVEFLSKDRESLKQTPKHFRGPVLVPPTWSTSSVEVPQSILCYVDGL